MTNRIWAYIAVLSAVSALLFMLDRAGVFDTVFDAGHSFVLAPITNAGVTVLDTTASFAVPLFMTRDLVDEYHHIRDERDYYRGEYFALRAVQEENEFLRQALDFEEGDNTLIIASVTAFDPAQAHQSVTINKGEQDGIRIGNTVVVAGNVLVGRVVETTNNTSRVLLVTSQESRVPARLEGSDIHAIITGSPSGALTLELIPHDTPVEENTVVLSSGLAETLPHNLLIGHVRRVSDAEARSYKQAVVQPLFTPRSLRTVFVITR